MRPTSKKSTDDSTNQKSSIKLPKYVKEASQQIIENVAEKEKALLPQADDSLLSALNYYVFHFNKVFGKWVFYIIIYLTCCQYLYPQAPLRLALSLIVAVIVFSTAFAFSRVFIYKMLKHIVNRIRPKKPN